MTQAERELVTALESRLAEVERERAWIQAKLREYRDDAVAGNVPLFLGIQVSKSGSNGHSGRGDVAKKGRPFVADPNSRTSRMFAEVRRILDQGPDKTITFQALYAVLPDDLIPRTKNAREITRALLRTRGERAGIKYVNADMITLKSPHLALTR
jgi:hypothetical protein